MNISVLLTVFIAKQLFTFTVILATVSLIMLCSWGHVQAVAVNK